MRVMDFEWERRVGDCPERWKEENVPVLVTWTPQAEGLQAAHAAAVYVGFGCGHHVHRGAATGVKPVFLLRFLPQPRKWTSAL